MSSGTRSSAWTPFSRLPGRRTGLSQPLPRAEPRWPSVSIVILLCFSAVFPPIVLTAMNGMLVSIAALIAVLANRGMDRRLLVIVLSFVLMLLVGLVSGVGADQYLYFKDVWYVANPVLVIAVGYILFINKPNIGSGLRAFVIAGVVLAIWQLRGYFVDPGLILLSLETIRKAIPGGGDAPLVALMILMLFSGQWSSTLKLPRWIGAFAFVITAVAVGASFARTYVLVVLIALAARAGCFAKREWLRIGVPALALVCVVLVFQLSVDVDYNRGVQTFMGKLANSVNELTADDSADMSVVGHSYRGYETAQAWKQYISGDALQILFGRGFGATVDIGVFLPLGGDDGGRVVNVRYINVLHNGYTYLLTKGGLVCVVLYVFVLIYIYVLARPRAALPSARLDSRAGRLLQAAAVALVATTYVIAGVFNKGGTFALLLMTGYLVAYFGQRDE